jgi:hypothetical protein
VDADGNPMTRDPGDLVAEVEGTVEPGTDDVDLVLRSAD